MKKQGKQIGLLLSLAAIFLITLVLPFHHHTEPTTSSASHCYTCQISKGARSITSPAIYVGVTPFFDDSTLIFEITFDFLSKEFLFSAPPRAPPSLS